MGYRDTYFQHNQPIMGRYQCSNCKGWFTKKEIDVDHIVPQNRGGTDDIWNLQAMCKHCNRSKKDSMNSTIPDLATNMVKTAIKGEKIDNLGGLAVNMVKKNTKNAIKKQLKGLLK